MEYRNWNDKPLRTSLLGYGCMRFPTRADGSSYEPRAEALLNTAKAAGVNYFDTAYPYHNGQSEPFVGRVIAKWERSSFYLATKMPLWICKSLADAQRIFEEQLQRLGVEYIDFYCCTRCTKPGTSRPRNWASWTGCGSKRPPDASEISAFPATTTPPVLRPSCGISPGISASCSTTIWTGTTAPKRSVVTGGYQLTEECGVPLIIMEPIKGGTLAALPADAAAPLRALHSDASDASWALRWVAGHPNRACGALRHECRGSSW